jgi:regulator of sigma E protease
VKLEGEDGEGVNDPRSFSAQGLPKKLIILVAGVAMNVILAFAIFTAIALGGDPTIGVRIGTVESGSPAAQIGLQPGDEIHALDGGYFGAFDGTDLLMALGARAGESVEVGIQHAGGAFETKTVTLRDKSQIDKTHGALGVGSLQAVTTPVAITYEPLEAVSIGASRTVDALGLIVTGLGSLVHSVATDPTQAPPVAGPIGIASQIGNVFWQLGPIITLYVAGLLSANLAVVNILPFPPLDGGRMLMIVLKRIFGARISLRAEQLTYMVGFVFLFAFLIWITGFDIVRGLSGGS